MMWDLPLSVAVGEKEYKITNGCDYRIVLGCISALNNYDFEIIERINCALMIFYQDINDVSDFNEISEQDLRILTSEMMKIINLGEDVEETPNESSARIMDWEHDFKNIAPPISRVLGYSVRDPQKITHWYDFVGAYQEMGECFFATIISIRQKKKHGKKLDKWEIQFYRDHQKEIDLPLKFTQEELEWFNSEE